MSEYSHPDHAEMESLTRSWGGKEYDCVRCERCHVTIPRENGLDRGFDDHDCDHYAELRGVLTDSMNDAIAEVGGQ